MEILTYDFEAFLLTILHIKNKFVFRTFSRVQMKLIAAEIVKIVNSLISLLQYIYQYTKTVML